MRLRLACLVVVTMLVAGSLCPAGSIDANRLTYLDRDDPYYVGTDFPRLTTPQWVGEEGVDAVVVLAIDDMLDPAKYEVYLRPILERLKAIDGRAGLSIMTCKVDPQDPRIQRWIKEGVNLDVHTSTHPCPLLQQGNFPAAQKTYHDCVDLLGRIPNNQPVAFRMPCCDSKNTLSPRFFAELFNKVSPEKHFLSIDTSVFQIFTAADPTLPRPLVVDPDGRERFRKYVPFPSFVNTIENYPYPYVVNRLCWEFPCVVPSDWEAQHLNKPNSAKTVDDMKAALDAVVAKQGVFNLVFHPHGWIKSEQIVALIDHAVAKHGNRVKFLNFREALERLETNLLGGQSLRLANGRDNGVRLLDLDADGHLDVVIGNNAKRETRVWNPASGKWRTLSFPMKLVSTGLAPVSYENHSVPFGVVRGDGHASVLGPRTSESGETSEYGVWHFGAVEWEREATASEGLPDISALAPRDRAGVRWRDIDGDGQCEILWSDQAIFGFSKEHGKWEKLGIRLPEGAAIVASSAHVPAGEFREDFVGVDNGLRFIDLDEDGRDDVVFSNGQGFGIYLFDSITTGWSRRVASGSAKQAGGLPAIVRGLGENNGAWVHSRHLWWQNEDTGQLPDLVDRRSFNDLLKNVEPRGKTPEASRRSWRVEPGFRVELAAQEPLVADPIAFDWGADGKLWVLEMGDYPLGADGKGKPGGRVRALEDVDGDGRYDKATTFLEGLNIPTGLMPWRNGLIVGAAPEIFFAEDRDGDGKADHREVLFTGFVPGNPQHRLNGFELGLDGWVYGANGDSGGEIHSAKTGKTVSIRGRDFRFQPDDGRFEPETGQTQYGRHRDDWGHWFGNNNPTFAWHYCFSDAELGRNPRFSPGAARQVLEPDTTLHPVSRTLARFNTPEGANRVTSANSPTPYRDDLFGPQFANSLFVSEPVHNLVHRMILEPDGATFRGKRGPGDATREFLASSDNWSRPTMLRTGPDGALWVADMYRAVIEHPEWIPDDWEAKLDLRAGSEEGRIYRVYPVDQTPRKFRRLDAADTASLVAAMDSPNGWQRDTAQRLLMHKNDRSAVALLQALAEKSSRPQSRVQALWTVAALDALTPAMVSRGLADPHPQVRRNALQVAGPLLRENRALVEAVLPLANDPDPEVRFQTALTLGQCDDVRAGKVLAGLVERSPDDPWLRSAVLISSASHAGTLLAALLANAKDGPPPAAMIEPLFAMIGGSKKHDGLARLVPFLTAPQGEGGRFLAWQRAALLGLLDAADRARTPLAGSDLEAMASLDKSATATAVDAQASADERVVAVRLLGRRSERTDSDRDLLFGLLRPQVPIQVQEAAVAALGRRDDPRIAAALVADWKGYSPRVRGTILDVLLSRETATSALLYALEDLCIPTAEIDAAHRNRLLAYPSEKVQSRAKAVFTRENDSRHEVLERYRQILSTRGDAGRGKLTFKRVCATCHRLAGEGVEVGPDLAALNDKSPESLLVAIFDPNRAFEAKFTNFLVQTNDGRVLTGLIAGETGNAITLRRAEGKDEVLLRADIEAMTATGLSLMPEGLEKDVTPGEFGDLIAFLGVVGPPPKVLEGNQPEVVSATGAGAFVLRASVAEIFGDMLTFEKPYGNLGYWSSANDRAGWRIDVKKAGRYSVWVDAACDNGTAGNALAIETAGQRVVHTVAGTGSWDNYRTQRVGEVELTPGLHRVDIRPVGKLRGALIDLRALELRPLSMASEGPAGCCEP